MATFALVHGSWHGGWAWDLVRAELEARGHEVAAPDLPCDDLDAGIEDYARAVTAADVVVGHSFGGHTIARVPGRLHIFVCALVPGTDESAALLPALGEVREVDEHGRSFLRTAEAAARVLQFPAEAAALAERLRPQVQVACPPVSPPTPSVYVVCSEDGVVDPAWQRSVSREHLGVEPVELPAGHSPMLTHPRELADICESAGREAGVV